MGFGQIFTVLTFILIFAGMTLVVITVQSNMAESVKELKTQAQNNDAQNQELTITATSYATNQLIPWTITYADTFSEGTLTDTKTAGDAIELATPGSVFSGNYTSPIHDAGYAANYTTITWSSIEPITTSVRFQVRTAGTEAALLAASFVGPDNTPGSYYLSSGTFLNESHDGDQFIQYRAFLTTGTPDVTPTLLDTTIQVRRITGATTIQLDNTGREKLRFEETDVYVEGVRAFRDESTRTISYEDKSDTRLWNPGEELNITVFGDHASSFTVLVANEYAQDTTTVVP